MPGPGDLYALQEELLAAAVASLDYIPTAEPTLQGAPARQAVVSPGQIALDCDQVVVSAQPVGVASTRPQSPPLAAGKKHVFGRINEPVLAVFVSRCCLPVGKIVNKTYTPPTAAEEQAASRQLNADGWAIWNGIFTRLVQGDLLDRCTSVGWEGMAPVGPSGACGGWILTLRVVLAGYMEPLGS